VLPKDIIKWVKSMAQVKDAAIAHKYESCSITFIKFVGIHYLFENQPTVEVIKTINKLYRRIDRLTDPMHLVEKIKTVGDVYMAASGIPSPNNLHAVIINDFCFDVVEEVRRFSIRYKVKLSFKIGISSGPIVAGVIGKNKFT
jgi:adenylate cyclase